MTTRLIYIGRGDALYNVPARDITEQDILDFAEVWKESNVTEAMLIASGLYEKPKAEIKTRVPSARASEAAKDGK